MTRWYNTLSGSRRSSHLMRDNADPLVPSVYLPIHHIRCMTYFTGTSLVDDPKQAQPQSASTGRRIRSPGPSRFICVLIHRGYSVVQLRSIQLSI